jgi:competence protein ComEA
MAPRGTNLSITSIGLGILIVVGAAAWFGFGSSAAPPTGVVEGSASEEALPNATDITVHVSGSVRLPGLVAVRSDARVADVVLSAGGATRDADLGRVNLAATLRDGEHVVIPSLASGGEADVGAPDTPFDINHASADQLQDLPGVGPVLAERIAQYREDHGPFSAIEDLLDVPGIGESKLAAIRDFVESP